MPTDGQISVVDHPVGYFREGRVVLGVDGQVYPLREVGKYRLNQ